MQIIGHQKQWEFLKKIAETGKISHAYLFTGEEYLGKKKIVLEWASLLLGETSRRYFGEGQRPDLILVEPKSKEIKIEQIRELIWKLSLKPYSASLKVAVIDGAHLMTKDSQNCFLKTLEEPKDKTLIILITEYPETLLPTIFSRCERIRFYLVKRSEIEEYLKNQNIPENEIKEIVNISAGRPGLAINFVENPQKLKEYKERIKELIKISNSDLADRFQYAKDLSQNSDLIEILNVWLSYLRNVFLEKCLAAPESSRSNYSSAISKLKNILKNVQNIIFFLSNTNVNPRLALEILMLGL